MENWSKVSWERRQVDFSRRSRSTCSTRKTGRCWTKKRGAIGAIWNTRGIERAQRSIRWKRILRKLQKLPSLSAWEHFKHFSLHILIIHSLELFSTRRGPRRALLLLKWMNRLLIFILLASSICSDERNEKCPGLSQRCLWCGGKLYYTLLYNFWITTLQWLIEGCGHCSGFSEVCEDDTWRRRLDSPVYGWSETRTG